MNRSRSQIDSPILFLRTGSRRRRDELSAEVPTLISGLIHSIPRFASTLGARQRAGIGRQLRRHDGVCLTDVSAKRFKGLRQNVSSAKMVLRHADFRAHDGARFTMMEV